MHACIHAYIHMYIIGALKVPLVGSAHVPWFREAAGHIFKSHGFAAVPLSSAGAGAFKGAMWVLGHLLPNSGDLDPWQLTTC